MSSSSISCLPDSATRLISSHVVVVTPVLLVKELLDNAIDAKATSVEILISPDTITKIEVRDDGVGIHPNDYDSLGKRSHTSKLRSIDELGGLVGKSLGFRGEALASVNSMANVTITTKTSSEPIAAIFQLKPNEGGILTPKKPISAPAGTTVSVTKLFGDHPVRRQMATKEAKKTLEKIQELLRSYAMARPQIKLLFKILHTPTKAWSYSPKRSATLGEAALQLFGVEVASSCVLKTFQTCYSDTDDSSKTHTISKPANNDIAFEAFLVNPNVDLRRMPKRHYFSVDGRPINAGRGTAKRLLKIYLDCLKSSALVNDIVGYFISLNISCPPRSYDVNIEPSKDDVLFSYEQVVLEAFRHLCESTYKQIAVDQQSTLGTSINQTSGILPMSSQGQSQLHRLHESQAQPSVPNPSLKMTQSNPKAYTDVSLNDLKQPVDQVCITETLVDDQVSREIPPSNTFQPINAVNSPLNSQPGGSGNQKDVTRLTPNQWKVDMSVDLSRQPKRSHQKSHQVVPVPQSSHKTTRKENRGNSAGGHHNPWEIAKVSGRNQASSQNLDMAIQYSPISPLTSEPPILRHVMAPPGDLDVPRSHKDAGRARLVYPQQIAVPGGPYRSPVSSPLSNRSQGVPVIPPNRPPINLSHHHRRREQPPWTPPSSLEKPRYRNAWDVNATLPQRTDGFKQTQISFGGTQAGKRQRAMQGDIPRPRLRSTIPVDEPDADDQLEIQDIFSTAKKNLHYQLSQMEDGQSMKAVHNREPQGHQQQPLRQRQPFALLQANSFGNNGVPEADRELIETTLPIDDPRAYLLRRQKSMAAEESGAKPRKLRRVKSSLMPLENVLPEYDTHGLSWTVSIDSSFLNELIQWVRKYDEYVINGALFDGLDMGLADGQVVESQLQKLLAEQKENIADGGAGNDPVIIDLQAALKGKSVLDAPVT